MPTPSKRRDVIQPDAEGIAAIVDKYRHDQHELADQLDLFFELFRGLGVPMTFSAISLVTLDEAFLSLLEQLEQETGGGKEEGEDLALIVQLCGFYWGCLLIEELGGGWYHDPEEGSVVQGARGHLAEPIDPFEPFITKAQNPRFSLVKEYEMLTGTKLGEPGETDA